MSDKYTLTAEGYENLLKEYNDLKDNKRPKAVDRLKRAREMGDLSENSEYVASKDALLFVDGRIAEIEEILKNVKVVDQKISKKIIDIGSQVEVEVDGKREIFTIVGEWESDPLKKKLSHTSPIGKALMEKKRGDAVEIEIPIGKVIYKIIDIK